MPSTPLTDESGEFTLITEAGDELSLEADYLRPPAPYMPPRRGRYADAAEVSVGPTDGLGTVWYTLDGSLPVPGRCRRSEAGSGLLRLDGNARLRAVTVLDGVVGDEDAADCLFNVSAPRNPGRGGDSYGAGRVYVPPPAENDGRVPAERPLPPLITPAGPLTRFGGVVAVSIAAGDGAAAAIYCTTDGTAPSAYSVRYTVPFTLARSAVVRAVAVSAAGEQSEEARPSRFVRLAAGPGETP